MVMKKWKVINELLDRLGGRNFHDFLSEDVPEELTIICFAPHISPHAWIAKYKRVYMCFMDNGNGWWSFYSAAGYLDLLIAKYHIWKFKRKG